MTWEELIALQAKEEKVRRKPRHEEDNLQISCVRWFDMQYPQYRLLLYHTPNEGKVTRTQAVIRKKMGIRAGVADLLLLLPHQHYHYLAIELKTKTGRQRETQKEWQSVCEAHGGRYVIIRSIEEFINEVTSWLSEEQEQQRL